MKPNRILYVTRIVRGGVEVVVEQLARGLDNNRYEPIVLFDTDIQSDIRERLSNSGIRRIDLRKCEEKQAPFPPEIRRNRDIAAKVESHFGSRTYQFYFSMKAFYDFLRYQAPRVKLYVNAIRGKWDRSSSYAPKFRRRKAGNYSFKDSWCSLYIS